jgi:hypothetical protein
MSNNRESSQMKNHKKGGPGTKPQNEDAMQGGVSLYSKDEIDEKDALIE